MRADLRYSGPPGGFGVGVRVACAGVVTAGVGEVDIGPSTVRPRDEVAGRDGRAVRRQT